MKALIANRLKAIPPRLRYVALALVVLLLGLMGWFFFLRPAGGSTPIVQQPPSRPALGKVVSLPDYRRAIEDALSAVQEARTASDADGRKEAVEHARVALEGVEGASVLPAGASNATPSQIDNTHLLHELGRDDPDLSALEIALTMLSTSLDATSTEALQGTMAGSRAITALNSVLSDPIFDYTRTETPLQRLARWLAGMTGDADPGDTLWRWFLSIVAGIVGGALTYLATDRIRSRWTRLGLSILAGFATGILFFYATDALDLTFKLLGAIGLVVAAVAVGLMLSGMNRASSPASVHPLSELATMLGMSAVEARSKAEEAAAQDDYRSAIRYRCLAVLLALDEVGMLTFDRTTTNREYLFRAPGTIHDDLQPLLDRFDQIWYGNSPATADEWPANTARAASIEARVAAELKAKNKAA